ncbi:hypothetical protein ABH926_008318 [Catenulispora sp. GP43]|uniref:hypothetical protein n=1 Tax=Catenulispora sp. GP43 TaxID=3156263 RepID=UPI0035122CBE
MAGLMVVGAGAVAGTAAADGAGPVATPPSAPKTQTVSGVAANGVQLSMTAPAQLPLDLPGQQLPEREVDVTVKDAGGQGYTGAVTMTLTSEGSGVSATALRLDHYDQASGSWQTVPVPAGQASVTVTDDVTVPASGTQVLKLRMSPGTTAVDDVRVSASANGATAVASMPVTGPTFQVSGLTGSGRAGAPMVLTGTLDNPTDLSLQDVPVKLLLCSAGSAGCIAHASDVKVEEQTGGGTWHTVPVSDATATSPMSATVVPQLTVPAGGSAQFLVRVTVGAGAFAAPGQAPGQPGSSATSSSSSSSSAPAQPVAVAVALSPVGLSFAAQPTVSGTLTVQPPPPAPSTPSSTPSSSATPTAPAPTATETTTDSSTAAPTASPTPDPASTTEAASTPDAASSSSNPTILVAVGLLAVCLALVLWWVLMKRRERMALAGAADHGHDHDRDHDYGGDHDHGGDHGDGDGQAHGTE